jgi:hypothetical protein
MSNQTPPTPAPDTFSAIYGVAEEAVFHAINTIHTRLGFDPMLSRPEAVLPCVTAIQCAVAILIAGLRATYTKEADFNEAIGAIRFMEKKIAEQFKAQSSNRGPAPGA